MSNNNDNIQGNQENQQLQGNLQDNHTPVPSPQSSPQRSREGTPDGSHANGNTQFENVEAIDEALQKLIVEQVNKAFEAFASQLPVAPPTPTPNNNTLENSRSRLVNSETAQGAKYSTKLNIEEDIISRTSRNINSVANSSRRNEEKYQSQNPVEGTTTQTSTEQGRTDMDTRPDTIQEPEENENIKTTIEELETVVLFAQWPDRKVYIGANLSQDMKGTPPEVMTHKLNEDSSYPPVKQKKRKQGTFKNQVIQDEVQKLLKFGSIREIMQKFNMKLNPEKYAFGVASGRLAKWVIELSEYDIIYQPSTAIKSQVLADFVADFSQGGADLGIVFVPPTGETIRQAIKSHSITNNEAECEAVIAGLELARELGINQLVIKSDSQLVVNQMLGTYTAREAQMQ
ncbi:uncharacterized protein [Nicotiana sylvestris]|uniref:uncharacterized protein n=1 Tax=Nicotiana sylvestris TaxID=4096 RepID=UPI00388C8732